MVIAIRARADYRRRETDQVYGAPAEHIVNIFLCFFSLFFRVVKNRDLLRDRDTQVSIPIYIYITTCHGYGRGSKRRVVKAAKAAFSSRRNGEFAREKNVFRNPSINRVLPLFLPSTCLEF